MITLLPTHALLDSIERRKLNAHTHTLTRVGICLTPEHVLTIGAEGLAWLEKLGMVLTPDAEGGVRASPGAPIPATAVIP